MKHSIAVMLLCLCLLPTTGLAKPGASKNFGEKDWSALRGMAALDGKVYVASAVTLWEVDKAGKARDLAPKSEAGWGRTTAITTLGDKLYVINEDVLYEVDPKAKGKVKKLGEDWGSVPAMAGLGGKLYIVASEELYEVDPASGQYKSLSSDWYNVDGMAALDGKLYILRRDQLEQVDPAGTGKAFEGTYNSPTGMTALGGKLYISASERTTHPDAKLINEAALYEVDPTGKRTRIALPKGWDLSSGVTAMTGLDGKLYLSMPGMSRSTFFSLDVK